MNAHAHKHAITHTNVHMRVCKCTFKYCNQWYFDWLIHYVTCLIHYVTWLNSLCDMTHSLCDMTHSLCDMAHLLCDMPHPICDMTHSLCDWCNIEYPIDITSVAKACKYCCSTLQRIVICCCVQSIRRPNSLDYCSCVCVCVNFCLYVRVCITPQMKPSLFHFFFFPLWAN